jgi:hypothetical protein
VTVNGAEITNNDVTELTNTGPASGGGIHFTGGNAVQALNISNGGTVNGNTVVGQEAQGAGINALMNAGSFAITNAQVSNNTVTVTDDGDAPSLEGGGGLMLTGASPVLIQQATFDNNTANVQDGQDTATGGGIFDMGTLTIESSTLSNNTVMGGDNGNINGTPRGAGLNSAQPAGATQIVNSTFSGNTAVSGAQPSTAGAILGDTSQILLIAHTTFAGNSTGSADAIALSGGFTAANFTLRGSVIDEGALACVPQGFSEDPNGFNVDAGSSCVGVNNDTDLKNVPSASIGLGPLANNGGPTLTRSLAPNSPAVDLVPTTGENCDGAGPMPTDLATDQRGLGFPRPFPAAGNCDAGAYELQDSDGDGLRDTGDACPLQFGPASNGGCPVAATPITPVTPLTPVTPTTPAAPKKCKKGQKLKKGKCVKKKRKKK